MSKLPTDTRLERHVAEDPEALARLMTRFMGDVVDALRGLTLEENVDAQWHTFTVRVPDRVTGLVMAGYTAPTASFTAATETVINFSTVEWDTHDAVDVGSGWLFTAPVGGKYLVTACATLDAPTADAHAKLMLFKEGVAHKRLGHAQADTANGTLSVSGSCVVGLEQGQTLQLKLTSSATLSLDGDNDTYVQITEVDSTVFDDPVPAECWPYDFRHLYDTRPRAVIVCSVKDIVNNAPADFNGVHWDYYMSADGRPVIRIRNISGLTPGRNYEITLLVLRS